MQVLEFDHQNDVVKRNAVTRLMYGNWKESVIAAEVAKCVILCGNCHAKKTAAERLYYTHTFLECGAVNDRLPNRGARKTYVIQHLLANPCCVCGETDIRCLEFDHVDPTTKFRNVSAIVENNKFELLEREIAKCRVMCRNCHRLHTLRQNSAKKLLM